MPKGQRRYVESLSAYARQFLERIEKPDVDLIDGLAPAIAIKQKNTTRNPRSTVATATEIYDYLRLLYARCGTVHCIYCDGLVKRDSVDEAAEAVLALGEGTRLNVRCFPCNCDARRRPDAKTGQSLPSRRTAKSAPKPSRWRRRRLAAHGNAEGAAHELRTGGFNRLWQQGRIVEFSTPESLLDLDFHASVFVLLDRIVVSVENRAHCGRGRDRLPRGRRGDLRRSSTPRKVRDSGRGCGFQRCVRVQELPSAGQASRSRGCSASTIPSARARAARDLATPWTSTEPGDPRQGLSLNDGAIDPWNRPKYRPWFTNCASAPPLGVPLDVPWRECRSGARDRAARQRKLRGRVWFFAQMERKKYKLHVRVMLSKYRGYAECPDCRGQRLRAEARAVRISKWKDGRQKHLPGDGADHREAQEFFDALKLTPMQEEIAGPILEEVRQRLSFLDAVGLEYLTLDRLASTLSGARRSAFNWPPRSARGWWGRSTCWTSPPSACTRATRRG
jgi:excinuclease ABC subunit A